LDLRENPLELLPREFRDPSSDDVLAWVRRELVFYHSAVKEWESHEIESELLQPHPHPHALSLFFFFKGIVRFEHPNTVDTHSLYRTCRLLSCSDSWIAVRVLLPPMLSHISLSHQLFARYFTWCAKRYGDGTMTVKHFLEQVALLLPPEYRKLVNPPRPPPPKPRPGEQGGRGGGGGGVRGDGGSVVSALTDGKGSLATPAAKSAAWKAASSAASSAGAGTSVSSSSSVSATTGASSSAAGTAATEGEWKIWGVLCSYACE
jgi:hypothetical protein